MNFKFNKLLLLLLIGSVNASAQTIDNVPIGEIIAAGSSGVTLRDGTVLRAEVISLGTASPPYTDHGIYNQYEFGGVYNGFNDGALTPTGPDGNGLGGYSGDLNPLNFTRISAAPRGDIDRGEISNFGNAIGFHFWSSRPIQAKELLLIDCDGSNTAANQEWFTIFGYNGTTAVNPTVSLSGGTELAHNLETVNSSWHTLVDTKIAGSVPSFTTKRIAKNTTGVTPATNDPDDLDNQALFDFGTNKVDHLFILWGIRNDLAAGGHALSGTQNSGVSPLVFTFDFDYGDAPNSYSTNKSSNGPVHVVPALPLITLGSTITTENNGTPGLLANGDIDDGITTIDSIMRRPAFATDTIGTYTLTVNYTNNTGSTANYAAWIDWNNNGTFQASEGLTATSAALSTSGTVTFTWTNAILLNHLTTDHTYARIRVSTEVITTANDKNAPFQDGEVEDYYLPMSDMGSGPLPVQLLAFRATPQENNVDLKWEVADQSAVHSYEVHKSSNGKEFAIIGKVKAEENLSSYNLKDYNPYQGLNFYRLKSVDMDGKYQYSSQTLSLNFSKAENKQVFVFPNPANKTITIKKTYLAENLELMVYNHLGQLVLQKVLVKESTPVDISGLKTGTHYFKVYSGNVILSTHKIEVTP